MKRIDLIVGTRPEAIKMAPVHLALRGLQRTDLSVRLISTGQHRELLTQALRDFGLTPDLDLGAMRPGQSLAKLTSTILDGLDSLYSAEKPDLVLVHGDTTTCFAAGLAAFYRNIPFAHVEAGLRTYRLDSPFPEEFNRQSTARLASFHFAPDGAARERLLSEGVQSNRIEVTGNTGEDALRFVLPRQHASGPGSADKLALVTLHRRESPGKFRELLGGIREAALASPSTSFVYPVHPNPAVREPAYEILSALPNVRLAAPLGYAEFVGLLARAAVVLTDSGGIQEEAGYLGKSVLILRDCTERALNGAKLIGTDPERIARETVRALAESAQGASRLSSHSPSRSIATRAAELVS